MQIEQLNLSVRAYNALKRAGIDTLQDLSKYSDDDLTKIRNMNRKAWEEIVYKRKLVIEQLASEFVKQHTTPDIQVQILEDQVIVSSTERVSGQSPEDLLTIFNKIGTPEANTPPIAVIAATFEDVPEVVTLAWALGTFLGLDVGLFDVKVS